MQMNPRMKPLYDAAISASSPVQWPKATLSDAIGFEVEHVGEAIWLRNLADAQEVNSSDFKSFTDYECFINRFRVQDYLGDLDEPQAIRAAHDYAFGLNTRLRTFAPRFAFRFIISTGNEECWFRFHTVREGEIWRGAGADEALLVLESSDFAEPRIEIVTIARFLDLPPALVARTQLESAGIRCWLADENLVRLNWLYAYSIGGIRLQVNLEDAEDALNILGALSAEPLPDDEPH